MIKYAIPACEQDGIKMRGFCFLLNAEDDMTPDDVLEAIQLW